MKKTIIYILQFYFATSSFGQKATETFKAIDSSQNKPKNTQSNPVFIMNDSILLSIKTVTFLYERQKIAEMLIPYDVSDVRNQFGELSEKGIVTLKLKDTTLKTERLLELINKSYPNTKVLISDIQINGLSTTNRRIKYYAINDSLVVRYDSKLKIYNIEIE